MTDWCKFEEPTQAYCLRYERGAQHGQIALTVHPGVRTIEWACGWCDESGPGFMPEHHASGACMRKGVHPNDEATRTIMRNAEWKDPVFLVRHPFRMIPEVTEAAQRMVNVLMRGEVGYTDGGGI